MLGHKSYNICTICCYIYRIVIMTSVCKHLNKILNENIMTKFLNVESRVAILNMKFQYMYNLKLLTVLYVIISIMISLGVLLYRFCIFYVLKLRFPPSYNVKSLMFSSVLRVWVRLDNGPVWLQHVSIVI